MAPLMPETKKMPIRLALRIEGDWWVAYLAQHDTMDGAKRLGSILMGAITDNPVRKQAFMAIFQGMVGDAIRETTGQSPDWAEPQSAPEAERAGRA